MDSITDRTGDGTPGTVQVLLMYDYDVDGNLLSVTDDLASAGTITYTYSDAGRMESALLAVANTVAKPKVSLLYDSLGRLETLSRKDDSVSDGSGGSGGASYPVDTDFTYDDDGRLTGMRHFRDITTIHDLDFAWDAASRLTQEVSSVDGTVDFDYDDTNQLIESYTAGLTTYTWDPQNRLTAAATSLGDPFTFTYNGDGLRTKEVRGAATVKFIWDGTKTLAETNNAGTTEALYAFSDQQFGNLVSQDRGGTEHYYHGDALGSTTKLTDSGETVTDTNIYDGWGNIVTSSGSTDAPFRYIGREGYYHYEDLKLNYVQARWYDPRTGRFISEDPLGFAAGDINLYRYVGNSPTNATDPSGNVPPLVAGGIAVAIWLFTPRNAHAPTNRREMEIAAKLDEERARENAVIAASFLVGGGSLKAGAAVATRVSNSAVRQFFVRNAVAGTTFKFGMDPVETVILGENNLDYFARPKEHLVNELGTSVVLFTAGEFIFAVVPAGVRTQLDRTGSWFKTEFRNRLVLSPPEEFIVPPESTALGRGPFGGLILEPPAGPITSMPITGRSQLVESINPINLPTSLPPQGITLEGVVIVQEGNQLVVRGGAGFAQKMTVAREGQARILNVAGEGGTQSPEHVDIILNNLIAPFIKNVQGRGVLIIADITKPFPIQSGAIDRLVGTRVPGFDPTTDLRVLAREIRRVLKSEGQFTIHFTTLTKENLEEAFRAAGHHQFNVRGSMVTGP